MSKILVSLSLFGMVLALMGAFATPAPAAGDQMNVSRDLGAFHMTDINRFGDDQAYSSAKGTDRDADTQLFIWTPDTYGLKGTYSYYSNGAG